MDYWTISTWSYIILAVATFLPVLSAIRRKIQKQDVEASTNQARDTIAKARPIGGMSDEVREAMTLNFERLSGTLVFWKFAAEKYRRAHLYCLCWSIPSAVLIPILTQAAAGAPQAVTLVTVISGFTAIVLAFHRGLKIEENFRSFRHGESEFYDLFRRILDRPAALGHDGTSQLEAYLVETETIRRFVRNAETNNLATLDEARQLLKGNSTNNKV